MSAFSSLGDYPAWFVELAGINQLAPRGGADGSHMLGSRIAGALTDVFDAANDGLPSDSPFRMTIDDDGFDGFRHFHASNSHHAQRNSKVAALSQYSTNGRF